MTVFTVETVTQLRDFKKAQSKMRKQITVCRKLCLKSHFPVIFIVNPLTLKLLQVAD